MTLSTERLHQDTAEILGVSTTQLRTDLPLTDQGLDSLRLMTLVESWRAEGAQVEFHQLFGLSTLDDWFTELAAQR